MIKLFPHQEAMFECENLCEKPHFFMLPLNWPVPDFTLWCYKCWLNGIWTAATFKNEATLIRK